MARETKVGLLAGLAFVICFAVILANRGGENTAHGTMSNFSATDVPSSVQQSAARRAGTSHANDAKHQPGGDARFARAPQTRRNPAPPGENMNEAPMASDGAELVFDGRRGAPTTSTPLRSDSDRAAVPRAAHERSEDTTLQRSGNVGLEGPARGSMTNYPTGVQEPFARVPAPEPSNIGQVSAIQSKLAEYTVAPGDSLSKIAMKQYGVKSHSAIQAIFEANRNLLTSPDAVRAGMTLSIPRLATASDTQEKGGKSVPRPSITRHESGRPHETARGPALQSAPPEYYPPNGNSEVMQGSPVGVPREDREVAVQRHDADGREDARAVEQRGKREAHSSKESEAGKTRWYQVRKNDRYVSIARDQLGDAGRWREIYELNKDKFADPQQIREGVRIKLPAASTVATAEKHR